MSGKASLDQEWMKSSIQEKNGCKIEADLQQVHSSTVLSQECLTTPLFRRTVPVNSVCQICLCSIQVDTREK